MKRPPPNSRQRTRAAQRGQAMVEYSILNWALIVGLILAFTVKIIPGPKQPGASPGQHVARRNVISMFLEAYQVYYDSYFYVLGLPFP